jgi:hypothetical protein
MKAKTRTNCESARLELQWRSRSGNHEIFVGPRNAHAFRYAEQWIQRGAVGLKRIFVAEIVRFSSEHETLTRSATQTSSL